MPNTTRPKDIWWRLGSTAVFVWTLLFLTGRFVAGPFRYLGYSERYAGMIEIILAVVASAVVAVAVPARWRRASDCAYAFLTATVALPVLWIPVAYGPLAENQVIVLQVTTATCFLLMRLVLAGGRRSLRPFVVPGYVLWAAVVSSAAMAVAYLIFRVGITFGLLGLEEVYDQRDVYSTSVGTPGAYLLGWVGAGVLPVVIALGLRRGHRPITISGIVGVLVLYSLTGYRSYLIGLGLIIGAYLLAKGGRRRPADWMLWLTVAMWSAALLDRLTGGLVFTSLLVRRGVATAGLNTAFFLDYFGQNPRYGLRHSVFGFLGDPPYPVPPARWIGLRYYGSVETSANANFLADGVANFGLGGALGAAVLLGLFLRGYDVLSGRLPVSVAAPALMFVLVALSNTALLTVLVTHGGFVVAAIAWLFAGQERGGIRPEIGRSEAGTTAARRSR
jgi:hypothetical protein